MSVGVVPGEDGETDVTGGTVDASHASTRFAQTKAGTIGAGEVTVREGDGGELAGVNRDVGLAQVVTADEASFVGVPAKSTVIGDLAALVDGDAETTNNLVGAAQAVDAELERLGNDVLNDSALEQAGAFVNDLLGRGTTATDLERLEAHTLATLLNASLVAAFGAEAIEAEVERMATAGVFDNAAALNEAVTTSLGIASAFDEPEREEYVPDGPLEGGAERLAELGEYQPVGRPAVSDAAPSGPAEPIDEIVVRAERPPTTGERVVDGAIGLHEGLEATRSSPLGVLADRVVGIALGGPVRAVISGAVERGIARTPGVGEC